MPLFDAASARENQQKAVAARLANRASQAQAAGQGFEPKPQTSDALGESFRNGQLTRVRAQIERVLTLTEKEADPAKLDRLAGAISKLEEIERRLSDRALPATVRAAAPRRGRGIMLMD